VRHELANRHEHDGELLVVFLLELGELAARSRCVVKSCRNRTNARMIAMFT